MSRGAQQIRRRLAGGIRKMRRTDPRGRVCARMTTSWTAGLENCDELSSTARGRKVAI